MAEVLDNFVAGTAGIAWLSFALCGIACALGTGTFIWHIYESQSRLYTWLVIPTGVLMAVGFFLGALQAGTNPVVDKTLLIPWIRVCWFLAGIMALAFLTWYWLLRIRIVRQ